MTYSIDSVRADLGADIDDAHWDSMVPPEDPWGPAPTVEAAVHEPLGNGSDGQYLADYRPIIKPLNEDAAVIAQKTVVALATATRGGQKYIYRKVSLDGRASALVTTEPDGTTKVWSEGEAAALMYCVVQPAKQGMTLDGGSFSGDYLTAVPPAIAAAAYKTALNSTLIPAVRIFANAPVLLADGRVASQPGYNAAEEVLINIPLNERDAWTAYSVPENPTLAEAQAAIDYVSLEMLSDMPFESIEDHATALVYFATCASRSLYGACPMFGFDAPERGTGKTLTAMLGFLISQGNDHAAEIDYKRSKDDEIKKQLVALALEGGTHAHVDEVKLGERVDSLTLTSLTTRATLPLRILGGNSMMPIEGKIVTFCGNNLQVGGDLGRRVLKTRLRFMGKHAASQRRGFRHGNLPAWVKQNRPQILAALHTVLAYGLQNRVQPDAVMGSYEEWTSVVLAGLADVTLDGQSITALAMKSQLALSRDQDETAEEWGELLAYIRGLLDGEEQRTGVTQAWMKMADIFKMVNHTSGATPPTYPDVLGVAMAANTELGRIKAWTKHFQSVKEAPMVWGDRALRILVNKDSKNRAVFRIEEIEGWATTSA